MWLCSTQPHAPPRQQLFVSVPLGISLVLDFLPRPEHKVLGNTGALVLWDCNVWHCTRPRMRNGIPQCCKNRSATLLISRWTRTYITVQFLSTCIEALAVKAHLLVSSPPDGSFQCPKLLSFISSLILFRGCWGVGSGLIPEKFARSTNL